MSFLRCFSCLQIPNDEVILDLDFSNNILTDVFPNVWQYERTLEELYLSSARINCLPPQLFYCQNLRILVVSNNNLESVPSAIASLRQLQTLNLSRNLISNVPDNIKTCKNLTRLDLSCNNLQRLPDALTSLISLHELLLNETYLEFLPANFGRLVNLKILELRLNNLITLPKSMARLTNLQRLDIGYNEFTELPEVIGELKQLRELWIDFNQIHRISANIGKLRELLHFEANGNNINLLPNEVSYWRSIEVLSLCTNNLDTFPFSMGMLKSLVTLKCESNELRLLPDSISNLENVEELELSHNKLLRLPNTIGMLRKLRYLFVDDNELHSVPDEICSCSELRVLSVSRNRIVELPQNIGRLTKLKVLNIVNNHISALPVSVLSLTNLTSLWISDNQSQPLVPLQYVDVNTKSQLTCFMLPQMGGCVYPLLNQQNQSPQLPNEFNTYERTRNNFDCDEELEIYRQLEYGHQTYSENNVNNNSPSRRICFAEKATIMSDSTNVTLANSFNVAAGSTSDVDSGSFVNIIPSDISKYSSPLSTTNNNQTDLGMRLMRSPTPYPKELRLMAKYVRNGQKLYRSPEQLRVKQARVMSNSTKSEPNNLIANIHINNGNQIDCSLSNASNNETRNPIQPLLNQTIPNGSLTTLCNNYGSTKEQRLDNYVQQSEHQTSSALPTNSVLNESPHLTSANLYYAEQSNQIFLTPQANLVQQNELDSQHILSPQVYMGNKNMIIDPPTLKPPPYHIARVFTKKTPEDLTNYETIRYQQQFGSESVSLAITKNSEQWPEKQITESYINDADHHHLEDSHIKNGDKQITHSQKNNEILNIVNDIDKSTAQHESGASSYNLSNSQQEEQSSFSKCNDNPKINAVSNIENVSANNDSRNCINSSINRTALKRTPWLFGVHKNPTVIQVALKWDNQVGFDLDELPNKEGVYVRTTVPNTNAARVLCAMDKLLEINGHDLTNINLGDAKKVISKAGSIMNIMLSRK